jgi:hypothetical protein
MSGGPGCPRPPRPALRLLDGRERPSAEHLLPQRPLRVRARYGIPIIIFFTTGGHADYHQVTDEPQYIDYGRMAQVAGLVADLARTVANLDHRPVVDHPKPDPHGRCVQ